MRTEFISVRIFYSREVPVILRPGLVTREMIAQVVGACEVYEPKLDGKEQVKSPGVLYKHYSPRCETKLFTSEQIAEALAYAEREKEKGKRVYFLCESEVVKELQTDSILALGYTEEEMAANLYSLLRKAEEVCEVLITIEPKKKDGKMAGVLNRLRKACISSDTPH